ncbi:MAG: MBG domain-containing protein, partial [Verrucomicrobiia bacterium]
MTAHKLSMFFVPSMLSVGGLMVRRIQGAGESAAARKPWPFARTAAVAAALLGVLVGTPAGDASELYSFTNLNLSIPDGNWAGLSDSRNIASSIGSLSKVRVKLRIAGEFNGDLYAYLRQIKDGRTNFCVLLNRPGRTASNPYGYPDCGFEVTFDDAAENGDVHVYRNKVVPQPGTPLTSTWQPDGRNVDPALVTDLSARTTTLSSFNGTAGSGNWTLFLADVDLGATNMLLGWELELSGPVAAPIVWATPADITYGTPLGPTQLNASSTVQGTFAYDPPAGTVLPAGTHTLSVTFTPVDTVNYTPSTKQVTINVLKAPLTITADNKTKAYGAALPTLTASYSGFVNGDTPSSLDTPVTLSTTATAASPVGTYAITASGASDANYTISFVNGTLTITKAQTSGVLVSSANPALPAQSVTFTFSASAVAPGAGTVTGSVTLFVDGAPFASGSLSGGSVSFATAALTHGSHVISAEYAGSANFFGTSATLSPAQLVNTP